MSRFSPFYPTSYPITDIGLKPFLAIDCRWKHAAYTEWYDDLSDLTNVDWDTVDAKYWYCTIDDPDRQRRKQAEFLVYKFFPWGLVQEIDVYNDMTKQKVLGILAQYGVTTPVQIRRQWYY
jgi:hypothetical protein